MTTPQSLSNFAPSFKNNLSDLNQTSQIGFTDFADKKFLDEQAVIILSPITPAEKLLLCFLLIIIACNIACQLYKRFNP